MSRLLPAILVSLLITAAASAGGPSTISGRVLDSEGRGVPGVQVILADGSVPPREVRTDAAGRYEVVSTGNGGSITVAAPGFETATLPLAPAQSSLDVTLAPQSLSDAITVEATPIPTRSRTATRTDTPLRDVPQAVTVISREVIAQQTMRSMADVVRYVPGVGIAQGEGNRDTPVFRGNSSTADFYVDGIRDDVQYFRDVYNVERVEALKGPNAMMFGRGGVGGILNRVTRQANWTPGHELTVQAGSFDALRASGDFGHAFSENISTRLTTMFEESESYRSGVELQRYGVNPTAAFMLGSKTLLRTGFEHFHDERTADRGIPSFAGRPVATDDSTFFGNADASTSDATVNAAFVSLDHSFLSGATLTTRLSFADYDKFYQNVFPGAVNAAGTHVSISAYNNATDRQNVFSQTDLTFKSQFGGVSHTLLAGMELGRQTTDNLRQTGYFTSISPNTTSVSIPLVQATTDLPLTFRQSDTDADNHSIADVAAFYVQDQVSFSPALQLIAGLRFDVFDVTLDNNRNHTSLSSRDNLLSPRIGLVYKPAETASIYASYSMSYLPRAGEQLSSLAATTQNLDPEEYRNYEVGAKWQYGSSLEMTLALYRLDRGNVVAPDPVNPAVSILVDGQRTEGVELSISGNITRDWSVVGAYAFQDGEILSSLSTTAPAGARLAQLPEHTASLWNKYDFTRAFAAGLGVVYRDDIFTSTDNTVVVPAFTRVDAALFYDISSSIRAQLNVENLFDTRYFASAHSNTNITPGSPRAIRLSWTTRF